ncbi:MAG: hypothetical protein LM566_04175 [Pyrobaculum sp.]|nr:hypothetical protein [Pyrobaculum sp.]
MIPRDDIVAGIAHTPLVALLSEVEEIKPSPRLRPLFDFLTDLGLLQRKGDKYKKVQQPPKPHDVSPLAEVVSELFQQVVFPHLVTGKRVPRLSTELQRALYAYTSAFQNMRIVVVQELLRYGGLTLVAGWFPCGFSSELMSIAGRDVVIVEEREDLVALELDRLSLLPLAPTPLGQELAAASFYAFENLPLHDLKAVVEKYGKFDAAVACQRGDLNILKEVAQEVYYIKLRDSAILFLNEALLDALGLARPIDEEKTLKKAEREEVGPFDVYILRGAGPA